MGRGRHCSAQLREQVKNLHIKGFSYRKIAEMLDCSKTMAENAIKYKRQRETRGRKSKISSTLERNIVRFAKKNPFASYNEIKKEFSLDVNTCTVRRKLIKNNFN